MTKYTFLHRTTISQRLYLINKDLRSGFYRLDTKHSTFNTKELVLWGTEALPHRSAQIRTRSPNQEQEEDSWPPAQNNSCSLGAAPKATGNTFQGLPNTKPRMRGHVSRGSGWSVEETRKLQLQLQESSLQASSEKGF